MRERSRSMSTVNIVALVLTIIGAINWLLVGLFGFDLVASLFANGYGSLSILSRIVYTIVGLSGIWLLFTVLPEESTEAKYGEAAA